VITENGVWFSRMTLVSGIYAAANENMFLMQLCKAFDIYMQYCLRIN